MHWKVYFPFVGFLSLQPVGQLLGPNKLNLRVWSILHVKLNLERCNKEIKSYQRAVREARASFLQGLS